MPRVRKKHKPVERGWKWWYPKLDRLMGELVRSKKQCEMCGSVTNQMQWAHVITRGNKTLRWDILNSMCLCSYCHRFKWHDSPLEANKWFQEKYPERYTYLMAVRNMHIDRLNDDYAKIRQNIKERNLKELIVKL